MAQYQEGTIADGPNGPLVFRNGQWRPLNGGGIIALPPTPKQKKDEAHSDNADRRSEISTGLSIEDNARNEEKFNFQRMRDLRSDFDANPEVKAYRNAIPAYASALKTANTPQGDLALIYAYAKLMDPASAVREGEAASVANADTIAGQLVAKLRKQIEGTGTFSPEARANLRAEMRTRMNEYKAAYDYNRDRYSSDAQAFGVDPVRVIGPDVSSRYQADIDRYWKPIDDAARLQPGAQSVHRATDALPSEMQKAHAAFLSGWDGNPDAYVNFRKELDKQYGYASVPDEQLRSWASTAADARLKGVPTPFAIPNPELTKTDYRGSIAGQGMSGVNEGIANGMGLPVDAMTAAMNLVPSGINAVANTNIPKIQNPVLGSQWFKDNMGGWGIYGESNDPNAQFARRAGQSLGASVVPMMGVGSPSAAARTALSGLGGGIGAATANRLAPGNPYADFAGDAFGSLATGAGLAARAKALAQGKIEAAIPTVDQLKDQAGQLYRQAEARGVTATPDMTRQLSDNLRDVLTRDGRVSPTGRISDVYPKAKEALQLANDYAGSTMNPTQVQTVRGIMTDGLTSPDANERRIAKSLTETFDAWANPQAPELVQARDISSRYLAAQALEKARELARARSAQFSQSGMENALRSEYRNLDRQSIRGNARFSNDVESAIENVSRGTPVSNIARQFGKFYPNSPVSSAGSFGAGGAAGFALGGPAGAAIGSTVFPVIGTVGRSVAEKMTKRAADVAELTARNGGAIPEAVYFDSDTLRSQAAAALAQQANLMSNLEKVKKNKR